MKIRITAKKKETESAIEEIEKLFEINEISDFYPNRGRSKLGRIYMECEAKNTH